MASPRVTTKIRRQASEDVARMFARAASACQRCYCGCALPFCCVSHLLHFLNPTPWAGKERKNASQHINGLQLLNTTWFTLSGQKDESIQTKTSYMFGTHKNVPAQANPVCDVHRKDRKRAGLSRSGTSRATQHGWSSLAASGAASCVAKKKCRLSMTHVWLFC